jgi:cyclopropane fatty-acyl-phospholipid synthase-like methyltransferase
MNLDEKERAKYQSIWAYPQYRMNSPGEAAVPRFLFHLPWAAGDTLIDLGCGTGRAGKALAEA